ncbi:HD-GYP domain-containing protein [Gracilibacillus sp. S3-1-1]|uniref:HD-GYP domain-containing protein n=1 Tax=Gracilibacillus pellucidus TaxID=3095368 RepID=A0ACC6M4F8_9BACI|nr:HD-GYP domain-containing protein [Gracilibacillus sp. S3-1-1]MDX8045854.1 HD-GYP domain-containing protein [Gracilibacillus sp. S3-1-1]
MKNKYRYANLLNEEKRTTIWFLWLVYGIYFVFEIIYFFIAFPSVSWQIEQTGDVSRLFFMKYIVFFVLLPLAYYFLKIENPSPIKYIYAISFILSDILIDSITFYNVDQSFASGNINELVMIMFSPIFVSKRFFYVVSLGTIFKYVIIGLILGDSAVVLPVVLITIISIVAFILLHRFIGYVKAVESSLDKQMEGIVKGVITTLELKDPYTRGHSERVANYAIILAKETDKFTEEELKNFYYACLLHDIGKIHIPDVILTKPGKLTEEEYEIIKTHPVVGAQSLVDVEGITDNINVIRHHHERWDGTGYPDGLKGNQIDYLARIIAIADAFDAMTSSRSYRAALSIERAYEIILNESGAQFDPEIVNVFKDSFDKWIEYFHSHHDNIVKLKEIDEEGKP